MTYDQLNDRFRMKKNDLKADIKPKIYNLKIKKYHDNTYRLIRYFDGKSYFCDLDSRGSFGEPMSEEDLKESRKKHLYEVKTKLRDYARNNDFDLFWTLTFDPKMCGVSNDLRFSDMGHWLDVIRKRAKRRSEDFCYIFIPEIHHGNGKNSGTIHWHGLTGGFCPSLVDSGVKYRGVRVFNCSDWKYGFSNVQHVRSKIKIANYVQKYMTKDLIESPVRRGKKKYWSSKNLVLPEQYFLNGDFEIPFDANFENDRLQIFELTENQFGNIKKK